MAGLRVLWVGRSRKGFVSDGVAFYCERIRPLQPITCETVRAADHSGRTPDQALAVEADALLRRLAPEDPLVLLDERGQRPDTRGFAALLDELIDEPAGRPTFIIGGAYGVDERIRRRAQRVVSLSRLTFPHQLVRLVLLEQIYRALTLRAGHAYHHD